MFTVFTYTDVQVQTLDTCSVDLAYWCSFWMLVICSHSSVFLERAFSLRSPCASCVSVNGISSLRIEELFLLFGVSATLEAFSVLFHPFLFQCNHHRSPYL